MDLRPRPEAQREPASGEGAGVLLLTTETIRTERLVLRPFRADDAEAVFTACQSPDIPRWIAAIGVPYTRADAAAFVTGEAPAARRAGTGMPVAIEADGVLVGASGVHRIGQHPLGPEIGYWSKDPRAPRPSRAQAGTLHGGRPRPEARRELASGEEAGVLSLVADVRNTASQAVARSAGFAQEGVLRSYLPYRDGTRGDAVLFSRLPTD